MGKGEPQGSSRQGSSPASRYRNAPAFRFRRGGQRPGAPGQFRLGQPAEVSKANRSECSAQRNGFGGLPERAVMCGEHH